MSARSGLLARIVDPILPGRDPLIPRFLFWIALIVGALCSIPALLILTEAFAESKAGITWQWILSGILQPLVRTVLLAGGTGIITAVFGTALAYMTARYEFPGRRVITFALATPLAIPPYIIAHVLASMFWPGGWAHTLWRFLLPGTEVPSMYGSAIAAIIVLSIATYPYVYIGMRTAFATYNQSFVDAARIAGLNRWQSFRRVTLPLTRPALAGGLLLVVLYCLSDFGAVSLLRYSTLTRTIYLELAGRADWAAAARISLILVSLALFVFYFERQQRKRMRFQQTSGSFVALTRRRPARSAALGLTSIGAFSVLATSGVVILWLVIASVEQFKEMDGLAALWPYARSSLLIAFGAAVLALAMGLPVSYLSARGGRKGRAPVLLTLIGYVLPGPVIGAGMLFFTYDFASPIYNTAFAVILACTIRFLPQALQALEANLSALSPDLEAAARTHGMGFIESFRRAVLPLLRPGMIAAFTLVFLNTIKELPATLILRPRGYDTLAIRVWIETSEEFFVLAAPAALLLILVSLPVLAILVPMRPDAGQVRSIRKTNESVH